MTYIEELDLELNKILNENKLTKVQKLLITEIISSEKAGIYQPLNLDDFEKNCYIFDSLVKRLQELLIAKVKTHYSIIKWWFWNSIIVDDLYYISQHVLSNWLYLIHNEHQPKHQIETTNEFIIFYDLNEFFLIELYHISYEKLLNQCSNQWISDKYLIESFHQFVIDLQQTILIELGVHLFILFQESWKLKVIKPKHLWRIAYLAMLEKNKQKLK